MDDDELESIADGGVGGAAVDSEDLEPLRRWLGGVDALEEREDEADDSCADRRFTLTAGVGMTVALDELDPLDARDKPDARGLMELFASSSS